VGALNSAHIHGTHVPGGGAVHSIESGLEAGPEQVQTVLRSVKVL
jgi:hypothetical protein